MASSKKLIYFDINGLAEMSRYILHYGGHKFEDVRYSFLDWPIKEVKEALPYGKLPLYEEDGRQINQSIAIARYLGAISGLVPTDLWEQAELDAIAFTIKDCITECRDVYARVADPTKKEELIQKVSKEIIPYYFTRFEKVLKSNNGHFGKKLSWVDFAFLGSVENINRYLGEIETGYPTIIALFAEIRSLPGVKEYITTRPNVVHHLPRK